MQLTSSRSPIQKDLRDTIKESNNFGKINTRKVKYGGLESHYSSIDRYEEKSPRVSKAAKID